jgi:hypothetical protein
MNLPRFRLGIVLLAFISPWSKAEPPSVDAARTGITLNDLKFVTPAAGLVTARELPGAIARPPEPKASLSAPAAGARAIRASGLPPFLPLSGATVTSIPNGCGSETSVLTPRRLPQGVAGADFGKACDRHDLCYGTPWASKTVCDTAFRAQMLQSCSAVTGPWNRLACEGAANLYYQGVHLGGAEAFRQAQNQAIFGRPTGPSLLGAPSSFLDRFSLFPGSSPNSRYRLMEFDVTIPSGAATRAR